MTQVTIQATTFGELIAQQNELIVDKTINARAYPKQDPKSHNLWAGKAVASMIKNGTAVEQE